jgi:cytochrome c551/c552
MRRTTVWSCCILSCAQKHVLVQVFCCECCHATDSMLFGLSWTAAADAWSVPQAVLLLLPDMLTHADRPLWRLQPPLVKAKLLLLLG